MKVKTSITISEELVRDMDEMYGGKNRSELIERAVRDFLEKEAQKKRDYKDMGIINKNAARLNREAEDVMSYQEDA
ncbi:MAG: ribbon-helix-helix domain-containing protein [Thermodesulfovibrionales bacterium]|nr:ribbon-helix-helix domain-containing protein [Thermodesulfovibrionales bacterium]